MVEFKDPHYDKELEDYINSHPMFCEENTQGCVSKPDFFDFLCFHYTEVLDDEFEDVDYALWLAMSLKCNGYNDRPVEITWKRINEFFTRIEPLWEEFYGTSTGFELRNQSNTVMLTDDEDFVV